jgi:hypothetical protein
MRTKWTWLALVWLLPVATLSRGQDCRLPEFRSYAGAFLTGQSHEFLVESELRLPLLRLGPVQFTYRHRETTPFLNWNDENRAEVFYEREELEADLPVTEHLRLIARGGYQDADAVDKAGRINAHGFGLGVGSPVTATEPRWMWHALAGGYIKRKDLAADWWCDLFGSWRVADFAREEYLGSKFRASLALTAQIESVNDGSRFGAVYRLGPELQLVTATGNRARVRLEWYRNDGNPFFGTDENGLLLGLDVSSAPDGKSVWRAWETRQPGWFPLVWGGYDVGAGDRYLLQHFEMNAEMVDFAIGDRLITLLAWFETRQEHRESDYANVEYSVTLGLQTAVGWESPLSQDQPLVAGVDFLHRSDHALNPDAGRVPAVGLIENGSSNLLPRFRLQTLGWDLPYRDPSIYETHTAWLHRFDWRVTAGWSVSSTRDRGRFAGQLGLNWDIATVQGYVMYARGIVSCGVETPDWLGEFGVRRPSFKIFGRAEDYGVTATIARGATYSLGLGINL